MDRLSTRAHARVTDGIIFCMARLRKRQAFTGWIALLAFLFGLVLPMATQAAGMSGQRVLQTDICSATGAKQIVTVIDAGMPDADRLMQGMAHCDLCCSHHHPPLAPPAHAVLLLPGELARGDYPPLSYQAPATQFAWSPVQSRGPPASAS